MNLTSNTSQLVSIIIPCYNHGHYLSTAIESVLKQLDASIADIVRTRMFVTNIKDWELVGKAHGEFFSVIKPVATMVEVSRLINDDLLIEVEVTAIHSPSV